MAVINREQKWLFLCEPHTASRATSKALLTLDGCEEIAHHHATLTDITKTTPIEYFIGFNIVYTVRNPLDVLVTNWSISSNSRREEWTFEQWLTHSINTPTVNLPLHRGLWQQCNIVSYYEHLQDDLNYIFGCKIPLEYDEKHITQHKRHWSSYYSDKSLDLILLYYQSFLDHYGYEFTRNRREVTVDPLIRERRVRNICPSGGI